MKVKIPGLSQVIDGIGDLADFLKKLEEARDAKPGEEVLIKGLAHRCRVPLLGGRWQLGLWLRKEHDEPEKEAGV